MHLLFYRLFNCVAFRPNPLDMLRSVSMIILLLIKSPTILVALEGLILKNRAISLLDKFKGDLNASMTIAILLYFMFD